MGKPNFNSWQEQQEFWSVRPSLYLASSFSYFAFYLPACLHYIIENSPSVRHFENTWSCFKVHFFSIMLIFIPQGTICHILVQHFYLFNNHFPLFYCKFSITLQASPILYPTNWYSSEHVHQKRDSLYFHLCSVLDVHLDSFSLYFYSLFFSKTILHLPQKQDSKMTASFP